MTKNELFEKKFLCLILSGKCEEADNLLISEVPDHLYKYFKLGTDHDQRMINELINGNIYFNKACRFEDKAELRSVEYENGNKSDKEIARQSQECASKNNLITCFCGDSADHAYMWEKYANNARGFRIKFKVKNKSYFFKALYTQEKFEIKRLEDPLNPDEKTIQHNYYMSETVNLIKKGVEFSAEDEYRVIYDRNAFPLIFHNENHGEYLDVRNLLTIDSIEIGENCTKNDLKNLLPLTEHIKNLNK